jgi:hypothetical protein
MLVIVGGLFDLNAYNPNALQLVFYYLKHDEALQKSIGRFFSIPDSITKFEQIHNMTGARDLPLVLEVPNKVVYTVHLYPFFYNGAQYAWDGQTPTYASYKATLDRFWGYIVHDKIAPVWVGEIGTEAAPSGTSHPLQTLM